MKNQLISAAKFVDSLKNCVYLFKKLWKQGETFLVHAPRTVDKTDFVLDIASKLDRDIVYINADRDLASNSNKLGSIRRLAVFTPAFSETDDEKTDFADIVIRSIEKIVATTANRVFIIDSVTRIAALSFGRNASAAYVMKRLVNLQMRLHISLLVIAHDSTKATDRALLNLADSEYDLTPQPEEKPQKSNVDKTPAKPTTTASSNQSRPRLSPFLTDEEARFFPHEPLDKAPYEPCIFQ